MCLVMLVPRDVPGLFTNLGTFEHRTINRRIKISSQRPSRISSRSGPPCAHCLLLSVEVRSWCPWCFWTHLQDPESGYEPTTPPAEWIPGSRLAQQVDVGLCPGSGDCSLWELEKERNRGPQIPAVTSVPVAPQ